MKTVKEFMDTYSQDIIRELGKQEFNTSDVVSTIIQRKEWQKEYIKLSEQYGSYNKLNAQIGRYLLNNHKKMKICKNGGKEESIAITGRRSPNQKWKVLLVPILFLFMSISTYSQEQTIYQKKIIEIQKSFFKEILVDAGQWKTGFEDEINNYSEKEINDIMSSMIKSFAGIKPGKSLEEIFDKFESDILQAKKLKSTDSPKNDYDDNKEDEINNYTLKLKEKIAKIILLRGGY